MSEQTMNEWMLCVCVGLKPKTEKYKPYQTMLSCVSFIFFLIWLSANLAKMFE